MGWISEEQLLFHPNEGVPEESADVQSAWWLDLKATSDEWNEMMVF